MSSFPSGLTPQDIAAFAEGAGDAEERARIVEQLESDPSAYEALVEAMASLQEEPRGARQNGWSSAGRWLAAAALAALAATGAWLLVLKASPTTAASFLAEGIQVAPDADPEWSDQGWSENMGSISNRSFQDLSFRLGVRVLDLEVALQSRAIDEAERTLDQITRMLRGIELSQALVLMYGEIGRSLEENPSLARAQELAVAADIEMAETLDPGSYALGKWAEAVRLSNSTDHGRRRGLAKSGRQLLSTLDLSGTDSEELVVLLEALESDDEAPVATDQLINRH